MIDHKLEDIRMATTFQVADSEVMDLLASIISEHFEELENLEVKPIIEVLMAWTDKDGPALKRMGHGCAAMVSVVKAEERSTGGPDVRIKIDRVRWLDLDEDGQKALLHHELMHLVPKMSAESDAQVLDDYNRPVIKLRKDDWMLTGFRKTVEIFGEQAIERKALTAVEESLKQQTFEFARSKKRPKKQPDLTVTAKAGA